MLRLSYKVLRLIRDRNGWLVIGHFHDVTVSESEAVQTDAAQ